MQRRDERNREEEREGMKIKIKTIGKTKIERRGESPRKEDRKEG